MVEKNIWGLWTKVLEIITLDPDLQSCQVKVIVQLLSEI